MSDEKIYKASVVSPRKGKDDFWHNVGRAFPFETKDGRKGFKVPSMNLVILEAKEEEENNEPSETKETDGGEA